MLVPFAELLAEADARRSAIGAFTAYNLETAVAVLEAATGRGNTGVMLLVSEQAFTSRAGSALVRALTAVADHSQAACCVQLDHVGGVETIHEAFEAGVGAVMADGSKLTYEGNIELVKSAVRVATRFSGGVEAELGRVEGDEEIATAAAAGKLTDPSTVEAFCAQTGADCLAVSIGNAHGRYVQPPQLDLPRLEQIHVAAPVSLSLHGASGLTDEQVIATVARGIRKVNVNTELRDRYFAVLADRVADYRKGARTLALQEEVIGALAEVVEAKLRLLAVSDAPDIP
jgi:ketose-bisphosphate aldolase